MTSPKEETKPTLETCDLDVPEGYSAVSTGIVPDAWEPKAGEFVEGEVLLMKSATVIRNKKPEITRFLVMENGGELTTIWESAGNRELFDEIEVGDRAYIKYTGLIPLDKGRNPMHGYTIGIKQSQVNKGG